MARHQCPFPRNGFQGAVLMYLLVLTAQYPRITGFGRFITIATISFPASHF
jgi:hypothetical protein